MKKILSITIIAFVALWGISTGMRAQNFKLYFANNISDIEDLTTINDGTAKLDWHEVQPGGDVYTNGPEVARVMEMFASTSMKNLPQQQQFWRMRDHSLLCFRINDGQENNDAYGVEASDGYGKKLNIAVSRYFCANMPLQEQPITIRVWKVGEAGDTLTFKYHVHDWNDQNLYIFQLDSKRQADGETYNLEYVLSSIDDEGLINDEVHTLQLQKNNFQSFYVPADKDLSDVYLSTTATTGNEKAKRLRINKKRLHVGAGTDNDFNFLTLSPTFYLDRHVNRELVNFNWIGSGLFESYDTLYVKLRRSNGMSIKNIEKINVARVDADGNYIPNNQVKYCGYDESREAHKVLTMGNPVYLEILAPGFFPTLYRYPGAADPVSGIVDEERCTAEVIMAPGNAKYADFAISNQHFYGLRDTKKVVVFRGEDHVLCDLEDVDLAGQPATTTIYYYADGGQEGGKLMNGRPIDKYAQLVMTFSKEKGTTQNMQIPELQAYDAESWDEVQTFQSQAEGNSVVVIPVFTYDYYDVKFDLCELELNRECRLHLQTGNGTYEELPAFLRSKFEREEQSEDADKEVVDEMMGNVTKNDPMKMTGGGAESGFDWGIPGSFNWMPKDLDGSKGPRSLRLNLTWDFSITKRCWNFKASLDFTNKFDGDETISQMRQEQKQLRNWNKLKEDGHMFDPDGKAQKWNGIDATIIGNGSAVKMSDWVFKETNDIFALPTPGHSISLGLNVAGFWSLPKTKKDSKTGEQYKTGTKFILSEGGGYFKYAYGLSIPDFMDAISGKLGTPGKWISKYLSKLNLISCGAMWQAGFDLKVSIMNWSAKDELYNADSWGLLATLTGQMKTGAFLELHTPPNPFLHMGAGVRAGLKVAAGVGYGTDFRSHNDVGGLLMGIGVIEAYAFLRSFICTGEARAEYHVGNKLLFPDSDHNPFHKDYPYWAPKASAKTNPLWTPDEETPQGNALWEPQEYDDVVSLPLRAVSKRVRKAIQIPEDTDFGRPIVTGVNSNANPHFIDQDCIVYDDPVNADDFNDDRIVVLNTKDNTTTTLSQAGANADKHMRSKRGKHEIVVFEQMNRKVEGSELSGDDDVQTASQLGTQQSIMASMRTEGGEWKNMTIYNNPDMADAKPIVTIQEDGHAACVWQHGVIRKNNSELVADNEIFNTYLDGSLVLSVFDGNKWSEPIDLHRLDAYHSAAQYDLMMRNDTVLVGANITENLLDESARVTLFTYASVPLSTKKPSYTSESIRPKRFFMNRVGEHAIITMLYQKNDTLRDIYVKTLSMNGRGNGLAGNDLGVNFSSPELVKIVCDRSVERLNDFAILWTEMNNTAHGAEGTGKDTGKTRMMLNASRIALDPTMRITAPLTLGAEIDGLNMMDFDGFLDDQHIKAVYSLSDVETDEAVIMESERYFTNSFTHEVDYTSTALLGGSSLPVGITVINTGTSPIRHVTAHINEQAYSIDDSYVQPLQRRTFVLDYPITDSFDGYISTKVDVEYDNVFRAQTHVRRKSLSLTRQEKASNKLHVSMENIEMRLIGQAIEEGSNMFAVELIDHSTRGMNADCEVHVGAYAHPAYPVPVADDAVTVVKASDFHDFGGVRKAYATIKVGGVAETAEAYLVAHVYNTKLEGTGNSPLVTNMSYSDNVHCVELQPSNDPTAINPKRFSEKKALLGITITEEEDGVLISGLPTGTDKSGKDYRIRVFASSGAVVYSKPSSTGSIFVPLKNHDVYMLSTGKDILKFRF